MTDKQMSKAAYSADLVDTEQEWQRLKKFVITNIKFFVKEAANGSTHTGR